MGWRLKNVWVLERSCSGDVVEVSLITILFSALFLLVSLTEIFLV
jgi:hypothetical protein